MLLVAVIGMLFTACGGQNPSLHKHNTKLENELAGLRAEARKERIRMRDLEKRMALNQAERRTPPPTIERPSLPVEVREASTLGSLADLPEDYEIMGVDGEGVEIIYVGEATSDKVVKIRPRSFEGGYDDDADADDSDNGYVYDDQPIARPSLRAARSAARRTEPRELEPVPTVSERLAVTRSVPTIDSQLRQARTSTSTTPTARSARDYGDPRAEYQRYYEALRAGNHAYAVTGFRNFVERFPGHDFADNAQYWLGEAFYDQKLFKSALTEFRKVVDNHPQGNKVPDALLKLGYCYGQLGEVDKAKQVWQQILQVYPKSDPAALATTKLRELEN